MQDKHNTLKALIIKMADDLRESNETDVELLDILSEHILTITPSDNAVNDAVDDIEVLAKERVET